MYKFGVVIDEKDIKKLEEVATVVYKCKLMEPTTYAIMSENSEEELLKMPFIKKIVK